MEATQYKRTILNCREVKTFYYNGSHPNDATISDAINYAQIENCIIELIWLHWSKHSLFIKPEDTVESVQQRLPKTYGV